MRYILFLFFAIFLTSCSVKPIENTSEKEPLILVNIAESIGTKKEIGLTAMPDYTETLKSVSKEMKETPEFNSCLQSNIHMCLQSSVMQIAQKNKSPDFCEELSTKDQKESCKFAVTMSIVQDKGDISLCESLSGSFKNICIVQVYKMKALETKDIKLCEKIPTVESSSGTLTISPAMGNDRGQCMMSVIMADSESTVKDCKILQDAALQKMCETSMSQKAPASVTIPVPPVSPINSGTTTITIEQ